MTTSATGAEAAGSMGVEEESPEPVSGVEEPGVRLARHEEAEALRAALAEAGERVVVDTNESTYVRRAE